MQSLPIVEILYDRGYGQHYRRLYLENVLSDVLESAAERDGRSAVDAGKEGRRALVAVMHRKHRETDVLRTGLKHRLNENGVQKKIAVRKHYALRYSGGAGCEDDRGEVGVDDLSIHIAAVSVPDLVASFFAQSLPGEEPCPGVLVLVHVGVDDIAQPGVSAGFDALEDLVVFIVDGDDGFDLALDGELLELALVKLSVERNDYSHAADYREVGLTPLG